MRRYLALPASAFVVGIVMFWTGAACAADVIVGSVLAVRGTVSRDGGAGQQPLVANTPIHLGDTIISAVGKAKIALDDGTIVSVGENSRVRIADFNSASNNMKTRISLVSGALRLLVAKITPVGKFEVETETAIAAVRGTDWLIEATPELTSVAVLSGVVAVSGRDGQAQMTVVLNEPGEGTDVYRGTAPTAVAGWGARRLIGVLGRATFD